MNNCLCGKELTGRQRRYCSRKCSNSGGHKVRKGELEYENREYNEKRKRLTHRPGQDIRTVQHLMLLGEHSF